MSSEQYPTLDYQPLLNTHQYPSYKPQKTKTPKSVTPVAPPADLERPHPRKHALKAMAEELETPKQSIAFLKLFQKSAERVESLSSSLKKVSVLVGVVAAFCLVTAIFRYTASVQAPAKKLQNPLADGAEYVNANGDIDLSSLSKGLSMFIWGLVLAKAKAGVTAAASKDHKTVSSSYGKTVGIMLLIGVASIAKYNAETNFVDQILKPVLQEEAPAAPLPEEGLNLMAAPAETTEDPFVSAASVKEDSLLAKMQEMMEQFKGDLSDRMSAKFESLKEEMAITQKFPPGPDGKVDESSEEFQKLSETQKQMFRFKENIEQKLQDSLHEGHLKDFAENASTSVGIVLMGAVGVAYLATFSSYRKALQAHEELTRVYNHPNARVASGKQAKKVLAAVQVHKKQIELEEEEDKLEKISQVTEDAQIMSFKEQEDEEEVAAKPTLKNLPPQRKRLDSVASNAFNYSLCESIDYQHEPVPHKHSEKKEPVFSMEQVNKLLEDQKAEIMEQVRSMTQHQPQQQMFMQPPQPSMFYCAAPQPLYSQPMMQPMVLQPNLSGFVTPQQIQSQIQEVEKAQEPEKEEVVENQSMKIAHNNSMQ